MQNNHPCETDLLAYGTYKHMSSRRQQDVDWGICSHIIVTVRYSVWRSMLLLGEKYSLIRSGETNTNTVVQWTQHKTPGFATTSIVYILATPAYITTALSLSLSTCDIVLARRTARFLALFLLYAGIITCFTTNTHVVAVVVLFVLRTVVGARQFPVRPAVLWRTVHHTMIRVYIILHTAIHPAAATESLTLLRERERAIIHSYVCTPTW